MRPGPSRAALVALLLLAGCGTERTAGTPAATPPGLCRIGPDDGPPVADRGIGGTGAVADRGIGGTGAPTRIADRGIGGTGIVAVITGFASICLGGMEVALDDATPVTLNGAAVPASALRAGQLAIVEAAGSGTALTARSVALRQEVSGPVEAAGTDGRLQVAGQSVQVSAATFGERRPLVGQWVAVSGLRGPDGMVQATRIDPRAPGEVLVRGEARLVDGRPRIGALELQPDQPVAAGGFVTATGRYRGGALAEARLEPDRLAADPAAAFPPATQRILVESYAAAGPGGLRLGAGPSVAAAPGLAAAGPRRSLVELQRQPGGGLRATGLRPEGPEIRPAPGVATGADPSGGRPAPSQPAPVPRGAANGGARGGMTQPGARGASQQDRRGGEGMRAAPDGRRLLRGDDRPLAPPDGGAPVDRGPGGRSGPPR